MKLIIILLFFTNLILFAESSMFGAGNLDDDKPYGLSKTEEVIVKNKKIVAKNEKILKITNTKVLDLNERVDGIESLLEGESLKLNKVSIDVEKNNDNFKSFKQISLDDMNKTSETILKMQLFNDDNFKRIKFQTEQNQENITTLKESFDKIVILLNEINSQYVTKEDFNKLITMLDKKAVAVKEPVKKAVPQKKVVSTKSSKELMIEGRRLFKIDYFTKAKVIFENLAAKNYRPAECNYYLGEINYYRKNYKNALHFFKNSMKLYDKASYLPKLLLHSAYSFDKLGDKNNAQNFYNTIVELYPKTNEAKSASKKITK